MRARVVRVYKANPGLHRFYGQHPNRLWTTPAQKANQIWVGDVTYLRVGRRWRFLAVVMDQYRGVCSVGAWPPCETPN